MAAVILTIPTKVKKLQKVGKSNKYDENYMVMRLRSLKTTKRKPHCGAGFAKKSGF